jgi:hypothetical protein
MITWPDPRASPLVATSMPPSRDRLPRGAVRGRSGAVADIEPALCGNRQHARCPVRGAATQFVSPWSWSQQSDSGSAGQAQPAARHLGATAMAKGSSPPYLVTDIGGGSTEFVLGGPEGVSGGRSVDIGCVRMTERHLHGDPPSPAEVAAATADIRAAPVAQGQRPAP